MSAIADPPRAEPDVRCPRCGAALAPEQEWCVECGAAARTRIVSPPSSRGPIVAVAVVLALIAAGIGVAFVTAADKGTQPVPNAAAPKPPAQPAPAAPQSTTPATATPPPTTTATPAPKHAGPTVHKWPHGLSAYTVVLLSTTDHATAVHTARGLAASGLAGLARSAQFANIPAGQWIVFAGHYSDHAAAETAATAAKSHGAAGAYVQYLTAR